MEAATPIRLAKASRERGASTLAGMGDLWFMRSVDPYVVQQLERTLRRIRVGVGDEIPDLLRANGNLNVVRSGIVALVDPAPRHSVTLALLGARDVYSTLGSVAVPHLTVIEDAVISPIPANALRALSGRFPEFAVDMAEELSTYIAQLHDAVSDLAKSSVDDRLWSRLMSLVQRMGTATPEGAQLRIPLTHAQWAALCGAARESITISLGNLRRSGRITITDRVITIPWEVMAERPATAKSRQLRQTAS